MDRSEQRPICYLAIRNDQTRAHVAAQLTERGWRVVTKPTGLELLEDILGEQPTPVDLVIVEDRLPGVRGSSIAEGVRALGLAVPIQVLDGDQLAPFPFAA
jgi:DNA-binding response OmpR family regulator